MTCPESYICYCSVHQQFLQYLFCAIVIIRQTQIEQLQKTFYERLDFYLETIVFQTR